MMNDPRLWRNNAELVRCFRKIRLVAFDFDGVFTDNFVYTFENGMEAVRCSRGDGIGLRAIEDLGLETVIISTETNPVVKMRSQKLRISCFHGCDDKLAVLKSLMNDRQLTFDQVAFVGNDVNDLECLAIVGLPIIDNDAHPDVVHLAKYITQRDGGNCAVREICDIFVEIFNQG